MFIKRNGAGISPDQQGELVKRFVTAIAKRGQAEAQALLEGNFDWHLNQLLNVQGAFVCDWTESHLDYPKAYQGLRPIEEQVQLLADKFNVDSNPALNLIKKGLPEVPQWAEGWAAIPIQEKFANSYIDLMYMALIWHSSVCGNKPGVFSGYGAPEGLILEDHVRPHFIGPELKKASSTRRTFARSWEQKVGGNIMIVPVQMGAMRKGQSDRMVKASCERKGMSEFPLGIFEVACLLAMHPGRIPAINERALEVNAPGDEYNHEAFIQTENCRHYQMGEWRRYGAKIPSFGFAQGEIRDDRNGPVTASSWYP